MTRDQFRAVNAAASNDRMAEANAALARRLRRQHLMLRIKLGGKP